VPVVVVLSVESWLPVTQTARHMATMTTMCPLGWLDSAALQGGGLGIDGSNRVGLVVRSGVGRLFDDGLNDVGHVVDPQSGVDEEEPVVGEPERIFLRWCAQQTCTPTHNFSARESGDSARV
jgi:hypothetical protein